MYILYNSTKLQIHSIFWHTCLLGDSSASTQLRVKMLTSSLLEEIRKQNNLPAAYSRLVGRDGEKGNEGQGKERDRRTGKGKGVKKKKGKKKGCKGKVKVKHSFQQRGFFFDIKLCISLNNGRLTLKQTVLIKLDWIEWRGRERRTREEVLVQGNVYDIHFKVNGTHNRRRLGVASVNKMLPLKVWHSFREMTWSTHNQPKKIFNFVLNGLYM